MNIHTSVIAAVSTPPGKGGVAIIRISGEGAIEIASSVFKPKSKIPLEEQKPRVQCYGIIHCNGEEIDDGMATVFKAPASYTGEDTVEISCHGGILVTQAVLEAVFAAGAVPAGAGEFTRRAFINGKLSLTEAEAIGNLLEAESREQIKLSTESSRGLLSEKISEIRGSLTSLLSSVFARIDYPDEDLGDFTDKEALDILLEIKAKTEKLLSTYRTGKAVSEGIKTVICGKPNVGKSSVYNLMLGKDAAIVTDIKGTTRDVLTDKVPLGRVMLNISDTAGIRSDDEIDPVEKIGIKRSIEKLMESELILAVFDSSRALDEEDLSLISKLSELSTAKIALLNKSDLPSQLDKAQLSDTFDAVIEFSAEQKGEESLGLLTKKINSLFTDEKILVGQDAIISSARQNAELMRAYSFVTSAIEAYKLGMTADIASSDMEKALGAIAELDGRAVTEEVVADIFSKFCVGK